jgi:DNA polymerase III gamma/tau subunit
MQTLIDSYKNTGNLHHAYVVEGDNQSAFENICLFCEKDLNFSTKANPYFIYETYDKFLVDDARRLKELQMNKTKEGQKKIFVISFNFITTEAQNSLLKVLEEPTKGTHFFILTPSAHIFLDTIKSRVSVLSVGQLEEKKDAEFFYKSSIAERIKFVANLVQKIKDEKASKSDAIKLIKGLEIELHKKIAGSKKEEQIDCLNKIKKLNKVYDYLHDNSASVKQLLEYTAVII